MIAESRRLRRGRLLLAGVVAGSLTIAHLRGDGVVMRAVACAAGINCRPVAVDGTGRFLVYSTATQLLLHDMVTGADRVVAPTPTGASQIPTRITADGKFVLYGALGNAHAFDTTTGGTIDFSRVDLGGVSYYPTDWSQDLRFLLYSVYGDLSNNEVVKLFLYDRQLATATEIPLTGDIPVFAPRLSPDARYVAYGSVTRGGNRLVDRATGNQTRLPSLAEEARGAGTAVFTSDSFYVMVLGTAYETSTGRIVARSPDGTVSPSGRYVVYGCSEDERDLQFCVYDQITTLTSHLPPIEGTSQSGRFKRAVIDDLGRVSFNEAGDDIMTTCGSFFLSQPPILSADRGDTITLPLVLSSGVPCSWAAQSNVPWVTITSATSGTGSATITYVVSTNSSGARRVGTLTIAGQTVVVTQGQSPNAPPGAPVALRSSHVPVGSLIWGPPVDGGAVRNYIIEGGSLPGSADRFRIVSDTTSAPIALTPLVNCCGTLFLRVRAANQFGESQASNEVALKLLSPGAGCVDPPDAPEGFDAVVDGSTVMLRWRTPAGLAGGISSSYVIEAGSVSGLTNLAHYITGNTAPGLVAQGIAAGTYYARVRALSTCGEGPPSNEVVVTVR